MLKMVVEVQHFARKEPKWFDQDKVKIKTTECTFL